MFPYLVRSHITEVWIPVYAGSSMPNLSTTPSGLPVSYLGSMRRPGRSSPCVSQYVQTTS